MMKVCCKVVVTFDKYGLELSEQAVSFVILESTVKSELPHFLCDAVRCASTHAPQLG